MAKVVNDNVILDNNDVKKIKKEVLRSVKAYSNAMKVMACDMPIESLCLPIELNNILLNAGINRVYDLIDRNFTEIKGIGIVRANMISARLNELIPVS